jgi:hypothetical protein
MIASSSESPRALSNEQLVSFRRLSNFRQWNGRVGRTANADDNGWQDGLLVCKQGIPLTCNLLSNRLIIDSASAAVDHSDLMCEPIRSVLESITRRLFGRITRISGGAISMRATGVSSLMFLPRLAGTLFIPSLTVVALPMWSRP